MKTEYRKDAALLLMGAATGLGEAMTWATTPEGENYWAEVNHRLVSHAQAAKGDLTAEQDLAKPVRFQPQPGKGMMEVLDFAAQARARMKALEQPSIIAVKQK